MGYHRLTPKQKKFAEEFMRNGGDASAAYRVAYPNSLTYKPESVHVRACELLKNSKVAVRIAEMQHQRESQAREQFQMDNYQLMEKLVKILKADPAVFYNEDDKLKPLHEVDEDIRILVDEFTITEHVDGDTLTRTAKVKFMKKMDALEKIAKHIGFYREDNAQRRSEVTSNTVVMTPEEGRDKLIEHLGRMYPRPLQDDDGEMTVQ